jgi:hypothetical protein
MGHFNLAARMAATAAARQKSAFSSTGFRARKYRPAVNEQAEIEQRTNESVGSEKREPPFGGSL